MEATPTPTPTLVDGSRHGAGAPDLPRAHGVVDPDQLAWAGKRRLLDQPPATPTRPVALTGQAPTP